MKDDNSGPVSWPAYDPKKYIALREWLAKADAIGREMNGKRYKHDKEKSTGKHCDTGAGGRAGDSGSGRRGRSDLELEVGNGSGGKGGGRGK